MRISIFRKAHFNAAHRLHNASWSDEKNEEVFGLCNNVNYHGHNYELIVRVTGEVDQESGYLMDLKILSDLIKEHVEKVFDHKNLNLDIPYFKDVIPSTENFCHLIHTILDKQIGPDKDVQVTLYETPRNYVQYPPDC